MTQTHNLQIWGVTPSSNVLIESFSSFESFMCLDLVLERQQSFSFQILFPLNKSNNNNNPALLSHQVHGGQKSRNSVHEPMSTMQFFPHQYQLAIIVICTHTQQNKKNKKNAVLQTEISYYEKRHDSHASSNTGKWVKVMVRGRDPDRSVDAITRVPLTNGNGFFP